MSGRFSKCVRCGRTYSSGGYHYYGWADDGLCPDCRGDDIAEGEIEDGVEEFDGEEEIRCPWCGKRMHPNTDDSILYDGGEAKCPECGKRFEVTAEIHYTYDTKRLPE